MKPIESRAGQMTWISPAVLLLLAWMIVASVGCGATPPQAAARQPASPTSALAPWANFPADQVPRPIVMLLQPPKWPGFTTGDGKLASLCGKVTSSGISMPAEVPPEVKVTWVGGASASYPSLDAASALAALSRPAGTQASCNSVPALTVTGVHLGSADFQTDRGTAHIPSWLFTVSGAMAEVAYPALNPTALWPGQTSVGSKSTLSADGKSLTFGFIGAAPGTGPCQAEYAASVAESATAVAVAVAPIRSPQSTGAVACTLEGHFRTVTVALAHPLSNRVLVDQSGMAVGVCPPSWKSATSC